MRKEYRKPAIESEEMLEQASLACDMTPGTTGPYTRECGIKNDQLLESNCDTVVSDDPQVCDIDSSELSTLS